VESRKDSKMQNTVQTKVVRVDRNPYLGKWRKSKKRWVLTRAVQITLADLVRSAVWLYQKTGTEKPPTTPERVTEAGKNPVSRKRGQNHDTGGSQERTGSPKRNLQRPS